MTIITDRKNEAGHCSGPAWGLLRPARFQWTPSLPGSWAGWPAPASAARVPLAGWRHGRPPPGGSPAHDLVGQQHAAHLRILVLAFIHDGLRGGQVETGVTQRLPLGRHTTSGAAGLPGWQVSSPPAPRGETTGTPGHPPTPATWVSRGDASYCRPAQLFPWAHPGPELRRAARRARQGLPRPGHSRRGRAASQPAPGPPQPGVVLWPLS